MRIFKGFLILLMVFLALAGKAQDFSFEKRTIELRAIDTADVCIIKTKNTQILIRKTDFIKELENEALVKLIKKLPAPVICIGEQLDSHCKSEVNILINQSNLPHLNQKIAKLILTGNATIRLKNKKEFLKKVEAKIHFKHKAIGLREVIIYDSLSQTTIHSAIIPK
jgi:hypothetical protein